MSAQAWVSGEEVEQLPVKPQGNPQQFQNELLTGAVGSGAGAKLGFVEGSGVLVVGAFVALGAEVGAGKGCCEGTGAGRLVGSGNGAALGTGLGP